MPIVTMRNVPLRSLAIALVSCFSGCAASLDTQTAKMDVRFQHAADLLASRRDADSLAAAALLQSLQHRDRSLRLIEAATASDPGRPELVWLQFQLCQSEPACDPEPMEVRLRFLDIRNGAGWLGALTRANQANDEQGQLTAMIAISRSERVDVYWTTLVSRLSRAAAQSKALSLWEAEISIIGVMSAQAIPYQALSNACKGSRLTRDDKVEICRGVANALMHGDTTITEMIGIAIAKRVWPENSSQWMAAVEARRAWDYRSGFSSESDAWNAAHTDEYLTLCIHDRREQDVFKAELIASGKDPDPPASWVK